VRQFNPKIRIVDYHVMHQSFVLKRAIQKIKVRFKDLSKRKNTICENKKFLNYFELI
jgi:hypothetical protein